MTEEEICLFIAHVRDKKKSAEIALLELLRLCDFDLVELNRLLEGVQVVPFQLCISSDHFGSDINRLLFLKA